MSGAPVPGLPHEFHVPGSPVSVNRYGTGAYRSWRTLVHSHSTAAAAWSGCLVPGACTVRIRYFTHLDRPKDVDNILKAILDGLDGKTSAGKQAHRVLHDDRHVELVLSQRTDVRGGALRGRSFRASEYQAMMAAFTHGAGVFVSVGAGPNPNRSVGR